MLTSSLLEEVLKYEKKVLDDEIFCDLKDCPHCRSPGYFKRHEVRGRIWLVIIGRMVQKVNTVITRCKCQICGKTFTLYPPFGMRYKRYLRVQLLDMGRRYLEDGQLTYRQGVKRENLSIFWSGDSEEEIDERSLAHSTLYRWLTSLEGFGNTVRAAGKLLESRACNFHRMPLMIFYRKYRSQKRKIILEECLRLFGVESEYRLHFGSSFFPNLATACGWR